jgi:ketosteroid isomerase-like protein
LDAQCSPLPTPAELVCRDPVVGVSSRAGNPELEVMSNNVEIVGRVYDAAARRDRKAIIALHDREVELDYARGPLSDLIGTGTYRGRRGLARFFRALHEAQASIEDHLEELIEAGDDRVVSVVTLRVAGRTSATELDGARYAAIWTIRAGKVVRVVCFPTRAEALKAAGLEE